MNTDELNLTQYFDCTPHAGVLSPSPSVSVVRHGLADNEGVLELSLDIRNDRVVSARFRAYGAPAWIAVGEWLCEYVEDRCVTGLLDVLTTEMMLQQLALSPHLAHVAQLALDTLRSAVGVVRRHPGLDSSPSSRT